MSYTLTEPSDVASEVAAWPIIICLPSYPLFPSQVVFFFHSFLSNITQTFLFPDVTVLYSLSAITAK